MSGKVRVEIQKALLEKAVASRDADVLYDVLTQPLHEAIYDFGNFGLYDDMSHPQQFLVAYDYLRIHAGQGGFIQFLNNGYVALLPDLIGGFTRIGEVEMAGLLDDVLKVYVLNKKYFDAAESVEEFAKLYDELKEFESLDASYSDISGVATKVLLDYALSKIDEIAELT
jgi:hypothetical protein